ncbi:DUF4328 domain-containing protein [Novosphingobium mangrovi (ex Huang et al. 2023)]|uniref:DUF4328 domain-containing protein n=1 Tax=Novosphingobium mangrovi (ex Huang et al. 2023) TaxID=2976432 RepID=A0ABT2I6P7_9SPHN|nr:DUF4328 domain-containing protein [Novosphingobium mangrovi (ex Huang et al. 2023)]MCT2400476.1 DUF4328 domain-containing protein [Novosphingobium mangrovi (ex Huang et al. 2023)]
MALLKLDHGLRVLERRSLIATYAIYAYIALSFAMIVMLYGGMANWQGFYGSIDLVTISALTTVVYWAGTLFAAIVILMWIYRAHANLFAAGMEGLKYTPGWSVGWFFIPIANFFEPFQAMRELLQVSRYGNKPMMRDLPELVPWWTFFVGSNVIGTVNGTAFVADDVQYLLAAVTLVLDIAAAWCLLQIVRVVTRAQTERLSMSHTFV